MSRPFDRTILSLAGLLPPHRHPQHPGHTDGGEVIVEDFGILNATLTLADVEMLGAQWSVTVFAENLTDEDDANYRIGATAATCMRPEELGVQVIFEY